MSTDTVEIPCGTTVTNRLRFVEDDGSGSDGLMPRDVYLTKRDWNVADPEARAKAFQDEMGEPPDDWWRNHAQWYINEEKNEAVLLLYRRKTPANLKDWEEGTGK